MGANSFRFGEELVTRAKKTHEVARGTAGSQNAVAVLPLDKLEQMVDHFDFHERIDRRHLIGVCRRVRERRHPFCDDACTGNQRCKRQMHLNYVRLNQGEPCVQATSVPDQS